MKAFYKVLRELPYLWECAYCSQRITEGDVVFIQEGYISENTPVFYKSFPYHKKCYMLKYSEEECYFLKNTS